MNGSTSSPFGGRARSGASGLRQVVDLLRQPAERRGGAPRDRIDVRAAVLMVLADRPMDGYGIVRALEEQAGGTRSPGAGSVYPTLQLLADEGLASATEADGRRTWTLTTAGHVAADAARARAADETPGRRAPERRLAIPRVGAQLAQTAALVAQTGTPEQVADTVAVLDEARRRIIAILARD